MALAEHSPGTHAHRAAAAKGDPNTLAREVGANIRAYRKLKGLMLKDLARACRTSPQTIQRFETANMTVSLNWLQLIAEALGIEPFMLFGGTSAIGRANEAAIKARAETAALRAQIKVLVELVKEQEAGGAQ